MRLLLLSLAGMAFGIGGAWAQNPPPGPLPSQLRVWFAFPPDQPPPADGVAPRLKTRYELWQGGSSPRRLANCRKPYQADNFQALRPGPLTVSLRRITDPPTEIASQPLPLKEGGWYTLLVRPQGNGMKMILWEDRLEKRPGVQDEKKPRENPGKIKLAAASLLEDINAQITLPATRQKFAWNSGLEPGQDLLEVSPGVHEIVVEGTRGSKPFRQNLYLEAFAGDRPVLLFTEDIYGRLGIALRQLPPPQP